MKIKTETKTSLQKYADLVTLRDALKPFTQVSWTIKNLERKADIDSVDSADYDALLKLYVGLIDTVDDAYGKLKQILKQNNYETNNQIHKNRE